MAFRFSTRPHKQFLWFLIRRDSRLSKGKSVGLDAGCADMGNKRFFETETYIGLDPDTELLAKGRLKNPNAETINTRILDAPELSVDFLHCIQVFVNAEFVKKEALDVTRKLVSMVRLGGVLLMNTGQKTLYYDKEIKLLLESNFEQVTETKYGNFGVKNAPILLSLFIAIIMYLVPSIRTRGGHAKTYFKCVNKRA